MASKKAASSEAKFMRGDAGVDGQATKEKVDPVETEQAKGLLAELAHAVRLARGQHHVVRLAQLH
jgi:hypothetical protein